MEKPRARLEQFAPWTKLVTGDCIAATAHLELPPATPQRTSLHPEFDLLLAACGSPHFDFEKLVASPLNWGLLLRLGEQHRLLPALHACFSRAANAPASIRPAVNARFERHALRTLRFSGELIRVARHLAECSIPLLAHKGPVLGHLLYGDAAQRQFVDLDLLVQARDVPRARVALAQIGYDCRLQLSRRKQQEYLRSGYEYVFGLKEQHTLLELQWQILPRFYSLDFEMDGLFRRAGDIEFEGFPLCTLGKEDLVLVLCVHAAKHCWGQLAMLRDIAALGRLALNWDWIEAEARRLGIMRIVQISFMLAHVLFGAPTPLSPVPHHAGKIARTVRSRLISDSAISPGSMDYFRFMMELRERRQDRMRFAWRLATTPSLSEWDAVSLPDVLFFLYRGVRMFRFGRRLLG